ncbi:MAG TPA: hypothetical protein VE944_30210 [Nostoc sp.]|uniref:hypothetical protein n=1 Tax=Nostoc sp. TaxID=1180 RepID=UPI002D752B48|nr:hypothetical protein [Nostoc sp.]HYX18563.1 hypothetical protein [Nostoc sp.]
MIKIGTLIPLSTFIPILRAISDRNWLRFKELEIEFANNHGEETWADIFNFRIMPVLEPEGKRWLLVEKGKNGFIVRAFG